MSKKYNVTVITGKYTDREGREKNRYLDIGAVIETKTGLSLKLEAVPTGWDGWAYLNEPRPRDGELKERPAAAPASPRPATAAGLSDPNDDIPF